MLVIRAFPIRPALVAISCAALVACDGDRGGGGNTITDSGVRADSGVVDMGVAGGDTGVADSGGGGGDTGTLDAEADAGMTDSGMPPVAIPDPGNASNDWGSNVNNVCCGTPDTAYPAGIVTADSGYVQGNIGPSGDFFYVFRAGPALNTLTWTGFLNLDTLDLHDGTDLVFGAVIPPNSTGPNTATWTVTPNQVYVLHLHSQDSGFF